MATFSATVYSVSDTTHDKEGLKLLNTGKDSKKFSKRSGIIPYVKKCIHNTGRWTKVKGLSDPEVSVTKDGNFVIKVLPINNTDNSTSFNSVIVTCEDDGFYNMVFTIIFKDDIAIYRGVSSINITVNPTTLPYRI